MKSATVSVSLLDVVTGAVEEASNEWQQFLDIETMEVVSIPDSFFMDDFGEDYQQLSEQIDEGLNKRYFCLPSQYDIHEYSIMERFVWSLPEGAIQDRLEDAIRGRGAFRRFKDGISAIRRTGKSLWSGVRTTGFNFRKLPARHSQIHETIKEQTKEQKKELMAVWENAKGIGNLDYVTGWYKQAAGLMKGSHIRAAFVSTNSITQGEQVPVFWKPMLEMGAHIDFAYRTFRWDSEASLKAHVHCVIIGFSLSPYHDKRVLFSSETQSEVVDNINPYLLNAPAILVESRSRSICNALPIYYGSMPIDDGHLILEKADVDALLEERRENAAFIRQYVGGAELIQGKMRWCLWLKGVSPKEILKSKMITERIRLTVEFRKSSKRPQTLALVETPSLFGEIRQPDTDMIAIPKVSSERRRYIPISYVMPDIIVNGSTLIVPNAGLYHFGVLCSNVHMSWMRTNVTRSRGDDSVPEKNPANDAMRKFKEEYGLPDSPYIVTKAIVLRETPFREADKMLTLLSEDGGKLSVIARGARRKGCKYTASAQSLAYSEWTLYHKGQKWYAHEGNTIELFQGLRADLKALSLGFYFAELTEAVALEDTPAEDLLRHLLNGLYALSALQKPPALVKPLFELRFLCLSGFAPLAEGCACCGRRDPIELVLDTTQGIVCCKACGAKYRSLGKPLCPASLAALRHAVYGEPKRLYAVRIDPDALGRLGSAAESFLMAQMERRFRSLEFYQSLEAPEERSNFNERTV